MEANWFKNYIIFKVYLKKLSNNVFFSYLDSRVSGTQILWVKNSSLLL